MILNRDVHICDMNIEKINSTYFKITIELSDGKIIANKVNFSNASIRQKEEGIEHEAEGRIHYSIIKYTCKMFLEGICLEDENGVSLSITKK